MDGNLIPTSLQRLWNEWSIRSLVLLSLFLQLFLAIFARLRKRSINRLVAFTIWLAYNMADWLPLFTLGLISNAQRTKFIDPLEVDETLLAFWVAFLLIHLGGPDTITALSLEDNALWMRHLVEFVAQFSAFFYIFLKTLPSNKLVVPTVLVAAAGVIKLSERVRALRLASMGKLKKSFIKPPNTTPGESLPAPADEASYFFQIFKGLVVDIMPNHRERSESRKFFLQGELPPSYALFVIQIELDSLYEVFYTKILAFYSLWGVIARAVAYYSVLAALILYSISKKDGFHLADIWITYLLLAGFFALETLSIIFGQIDGFPFGTTSYDIIYGVAQGVCCIIPCIMHWAVHVRLFFFVQSHYKSWCQSLGSFNLVSDCLERCRRRDNKMKEYGHVILRFLTNIINEGVSRKEFDKRIWEFIFQQLQESAWAAEDADRVKDVYESRGNTALEKLGNNDDLMQYVRDIDYDKSLLAWHVATEICYNIDRGDNPTSKMERNFAKTLSDYMHYLLIKKPKLMSPVAGIGNIRFRDTSAETEHFCKKFEAKTVNEFCARVVNEDTSIEPAPEQGESRNSVLHDAHNLAQKLRQKDDKWEIISRVWVELLSYAAGHCRAEAHARVVSQGGELLTFVWLLMAHFGIGPQFPYP